LDFRNDADGPGVLVSGLDEQDESVVLEPRVQNGVGEVLLSTCTARLLGHAALVLQLTPEEYEDEIVLLTDGPEARQMDAAVIHDRGVIRAQRMVQRDGTLALRD